MHKVEKITNFLKEKLNIKEGATALVISNTFSAFENMLEDKKSVNFCDVEGMLTLYDDTKENKFVYGKFLNKEVLLVIGRIHYNYGYTLEDVSNLIFVLKELGCNKILYTNTMASLSPKIKVGDVVLATDFINFTGRNPLYNLTYRKYGNTLIDMNEPYDVNLIDKIILVSKKEMGIKIKKGIIAESAGPSLETVSEAKMLHNMGASFLAFNVAVETISAKYANIPFVLLGIVTNNSTLFSSSKIDYKEIEFNKKVAASYFIQLLEKLIENL